MSSLGASLSHAALLVRGYGEPGWILRMVCSEEMKAEFDYVHSAVLDGLQARPGSRLGMPAVLLVNR